jgi:hypothetical protein
MTLQPTPNPYLVASSICFILPTTIAAYYQVWDLYASNISVVIISSIYHSTKNVYIFWVDQAMVLFYTCTFIRFCMRNNLNYLSISTLLYSMYIYYIGYRYTLYIWSVNSIEANLYHISMHIAALLSNTCAIYIYGNRRELMYKLD